ncbi:MAG: deoxyribonuclease IV [Phycisphaerae bacterium]
MKLGSHLSISGGAHLALQHAADLQLDCVGMFVRSHVQWASPPLGDAAVATFRRARRRLGIGPVVAHASYLVNLAGRDEIRDKSIPAMIEDLSRCGRYGIEYLVLHPGSCPNEADGIDRIVDGLEQVFAGCRHRRPKILLETTAGQGNCLGHRFEQLAEMLRRSRPRRVGVCLDTAHVFAAGYDLRTPRACGRMLDEFDRVIGLEKLLAVHLNDSRKPLGSRVDRHEHIGLGLIGPKAFRCLMNEPALADVPGILETPKETHPDGREWDEANAALLRSMRRRRRPR